MAYKNCPNCGRKTHPQTPFCLSCGQTFDAVYERRTARPYRPVQRPVEPEYVPPLRTAGERLSYEERQQVARRHSSSVEVRDRQRPERPWWRIRVRRTELVLAVLAMPAMIILAALAFVFLREIADKLASDDGADRARFAASGDFDVGRLVTVGMTRGEIDGVAFDGVAGWRVVYLDEAAGRSGTLSAGELSFTSEGTDPLSSQYFVYLAFPALGTGATPVALFVRSDDETVFHVRGLGCERTARRSRTPTDEGRLRARFVSPERDQRHCGRVVPRRTRWARQ